MEPFNLNEEGGESAASSLETEPPLNLSSWFDLKQLHDLLKNQGLSCFVSNRERVWDVRQNEPKLQRW